MLIHLGLTVADGEKLCIFTQYIFLQADRNQDKATYEKAINEKTQALDDLFTDYNTMRIENQRLNVGQIATRQYA